MSDDPFRRWVNREVSEMDYLQNRNNPAFRAFLSKIVDEKVDQPEIGKFSSQCLTLCEKLGLSMTYLMWAHTNMGLNCKSQDKNP